MRCLPPEMEATRQKPRRSFMISDILAEDDGYTPATPPTGFQSLQQEEPRLDMTAECSPINLNDTPATSQEAAADGTDESTTESLSQNSTGEGGMSSRTLHVFTFFYYAYTIPACQFSSDSYTLCSVQLHACSVTSY